MGFLSRFKPSRETAPVEPLKPACPPEVIMRETEEVLADLVAGEYSDALEHTIFLKQDERLIIEIPLIYLAEERVTGSRGGYGGFSIRIARGFSVRTGSYSGQSERKVTQIDRGSFALTNKRVVFTGSSQSREFPLSRINSIVIAEDGIGINRAGKAKTEYYIGTDQLAFLITIDPEPDDEWETTKIKWEFNGWKVKEVIQRLIQE